MSVAPDQGRNRAGSLRQRSQSKNWKCWPHGGNPRQNFGRRLWRGLTPPHTLRSTGGGAGTWLGAPTDSLRAKKKFGLWKPGGNPWRNFGRRGREGLTSPRTPPGIGVAAGRRLLGATGPLRAQKKFTIWKIGGNPWQNFGRQGPGMADTGLHHPHPPTRRDLVPPHPLAHPASSQGTGSHKGRGDSRPGRHRYLNRPHPQAWQP